MTIFEQIRNKARTIRNLIKRNKGEFSLSLHEHYKEFLDVLNRDTSLKNDFIIKDIDDFFRLYHIPIGKSIYNCKPSEFDQFLKDYFYRERQEYHYYFRVDSSYKFMRGKQIGEGIIIQFKDLPETVQKRLADNYQNEIGRGRLPELSSEQYKEYRKNDCYMLIKIKTRGSNNATQTAIRELNQNTSIFNFFTRDYYRDELETASVYIVTDSNGKWLGEYYGNVSTKTPYFRAFHVEHIQQINHILNKSSKNEIEENILRAINIVGQTSSSPFLEVRFLFTLAAIENLVAGERTDYLNWRMSERLAFLLANNKYWIAYYKKIPVDSSKFKKVTDRFVVKNLGESRRKLYEIARELYDKRSSLAHSDTPEQKITEGDYILARFLLLELTVKLLNLLEGGISSYKINKSNPQKSLVNYIETLKFN